MLQHGIKLFGSVTCEQAQCGLQHPQTGHHAAGRDWLDPLGLPATQLHQQLLEGLRPGIGFSFQSPDRDAGTEGEQKFDQDPVAVFRTYRPSDLIKAPFGITMLLRKESLLYIGSAFQCSFRVCSWPSLSVAAVVEAVVVARNSTTLYAGILAPNHNTAA